MNGAFSTDTPRQTSRPERAAAGSYSVDIIDLIDFTFVDGDFNGTFDIAVTSGYNGIEYRDQIAWDLARGLATF